MADLSRQETKQESEGLRTSPIVRDQFIKKPEMRPEDDQEGIIGDRQGGHRKEKEGNSMRCGRHRPLDEGGNSFVGEGGEICSRGGTRRQQEVYKKKCSCGRDPDSGRHKKSKPEGKRPTKPRIPEMRRGSGNKLGIWVRFLSRKMNA